MHCTPTQTTGFLKTMWGGPCVRIDKLERAVAHFLKK